MKILVIGSGGREHALAWRLHQEGHSIYGAPGNPGIAQVGEILNTSDYLAAAEKIQPDLTLVGPEGPLVEGIVDRFRERNLPIAGPTRAMAQLEASKVHSKEFMQRMGIPTARFVRVETVADGILALAGFSYPVVIKADGLAAGKGVIIASDRAEAEAAVQALGPKLVIEEFLEGEEVSFIVLSDGRRVVALEATQDHKRVGDGDVGPNTGGMGAYCDGRILTAAETGLVMDTIIEPAIAATGFTGFLYAGLMMTNAGPKVLEFNVRLGDPETQPLMHRLDFDADLAGALMGSATGSLGGATLRWKNEPSVCVVLAAAGYPGRVRTGDLIHGISAMAAQGAAPLLRVFQAGTKLGPAGLGPAGLGSAGLGSAGLETAGGRVLGVTASGADLAAAIANAYAAVGTIHFEGMHYRRDIGKKGLSRWLRPGG